MGGFATKGIEGGGIPPPLLPAQQGIIPLPMRWANRGATPSPSRP